MKMGKKVVSSGLIIYLILAALLNLIIFSVFKPFSLGDSSLKLVFWFSYAFIMIAFLLQIAGILAGKFESGIGSVFFGIPLVSVSLFYFIITLVLSLAFMILVSFGVPVPFMLMFVLECIVLGVYIIVFIISVNHRDVVMEIDKKIKQNVFAIRTLVTDVEVLAESTDNAQLRSKLNALAEEIRYSDPMTNDVVADLDMQIKDSVSELEMYVTDGDVANSETTIKQLRLLLSKRNRRLADSK